MRRLLITIGVLVLLATPCWAFDRDAWRHAPKRGPWSREQMLDVLPALKGMTRQSVIALLGEPGYSEMTFYPDNMVQGDLPGEDDYRLSDRNDRRLTVSYTDGVVSSYGIEDDACECGPLCDNVPERAAVSRDAVTKNVAGHAVLAMGQLDAIFGPGRHRVTTSFAGGRAWANVSDTWHVQEKPYTFFAAMSHLPVAEFKRVGAAPEEAVGHVKADDGYTYIEAWPGCLPQVQP